MLSPEGVEREPIGQDLGMVVFRGRMGQAAPEQQDAGAQPEFLPSAATAWASPRTAGTATASSKQRAWLHLVIF